MKNKTLIISLSILAFFVLIIILSSAVFCLKSVEVKFFSNTINLTGKENSIIESGNFKYNQSIFFINKNYYINSLEENNPYIKVMNIETIFPNKLSINCIERNDLFAIKSYESNTFKNYMIIDEDLKVLNNETSFTNSYNNAILLSFENDNIISEYSGKFLNLEYNTILKNLATELLAYNNNTLMLKANFEEIILNFEGNNNIKIKMRSGTQIILKEADSRLTEKFMLALSTYNTLSDKSTGTIVTYVNNNNEVVGYIS